MKLSIGSRLKFEDKTFRVIHAHKTRSCYLYKICCEQDGQKEWLRREVFLDFLSNGRIEVLQ